MTESLGILTCTGETSCGGEKSVNLFPHEVSRVLFYDEVEGSDGAAFAAVTSTNLFVWKARL